MFITYLDNLGCADARGHEMQFRINHHASLCNRRYRLIGFPVVQKLIHIGYQVLELARSDVGANSLIVAGAQMHRGDLEDMESLRSGASITNGVIHTAFNHDFSEFLANCEVAEVQRPLHLQTKLLSLPLRLATA